MDEEKVSYVKLYSAGGYEVVLKLNGIFTVPELEEIMYNALQIEIEQYEEW